MTGSRFRVRPFVASHKKAVIATSVSLLFLIVAGTYIAWSMAAWRTYEEKTSSVRHAVRGSLDGSLKLAASNQQERTKKLEALKGVQNTIETEKRLCDVQSLIAWQSHSFEQAKQAKEKCLTVASTLEKLQESLGRVLRYLEDEKQVVDILTPLQAEGEYSEDVWQQLGDKWVQAGKKIDEQKVGDEFQPVYEITRERVRVVAAQWQQLLGAHKAKDRAQFEKASGELKKAYGLLKATTDDTSQVLSLLQKQLAEDYIKAFK